MIKKETKKSLKRKLLECRSSAIVALSLSSSSMDKFSQDRLIGSGVLLQLSHIGGANETTVLITDGLSKDTIESIKRDIKRTIDRKLSFALK